LARSESIFNTLTPSLITSQEHKEECNRAICESWFKSAKNGKVDDIKRLLKRGFKVNSKMAFKADKIFTALNFAVQFKHVEVRSDMKRGDGSIFTSKKINLTLFTIHLQIVRLLLESKADANKPAFNGLTSFSVAFYQSHLEVVKLLVEEGKADVDKASKKGVTLLYEASQNGHIEVVKYLMEEGQAEVDKATNYGATTHFVASQQGKLEGFKWLVEEGKAEVDKTEEARGRWTRRITMERHLSTRRQLMAAWDSENTLGERCGGGQTHGRWLHSAFWSSREQ